MQAAPRPGWQCGVDIRKGAQSTAPIPMRIQYAVAYCFNVRLTTARTHNPYGFIYIILIKGQKVNQKLHNVYFIIAKMLKVFIIGDAFGVSSNGRTRDFGSLYHGSNPCAPTKNQNTLAVFLFLGARQGLGHTTNVVWFANELMFANPVQQTSYECPAGVYAEGIRAPQQYKDKNLAS